MKIETHVIGPSLEMPGKFADDHVGRDNVDIDGHWDLAKKINVTFPPGGNKLTPAAQSCNVGGYGAELVILPE